MTARSTFCFPDSVAEPEHVAGPEQLESLLAMADASGYDDLDRYVEAHVQGRVRVGVDVETVVLDPCFRDGPVTTTVSRAGAPG